MFEQIIAAMNALAFAEWFSE